MNRREKTVAVKLALVFVFAAVVGLAADHAEAARIRSFYMDPTNNSVYFGFSTVVAFDAFKVVVRKVGTPLPRLVKKGHTHGSTQRIDDVVTGLQPGTQYRLVLRIRWNHGGPFKLVRKWTFQTNP